MPYTLGFLKFAGGEAWLIQVTGISSYASPSIVEIHESGDVWIAYYAPNFKMCMDRYSAEGSLLATYEYSSSANGLPGEFGFAGFTLLAVNGGQMVLYGVHEALYDAPSYHRINTTTGNSSFDLKLVFGGSDTPSIINRAIGRTAKTINGSDGIIALALQHPQFSQGGLVTFFDADAFSYLGYYSVTGGGTGGQGIQGAATNIHSAIILGLFSLPSTTSVAGLATFGGGPAHVAGGNLRLLQSFTLSGSGAPLAAAAEMDAADRDNVAALVYAFDSKLVLLSVSGIVSVSNPFTVVWRKNIAADFVPGSGNFNTVSLLVNDTSALAQQSASARIYVSGILSSTSNAVIYMFDGLGNYVGGVQFSAVTSITLDKRVDSNGATHICAALASASGIYITKLDKNLTQTSASALGLNLSTPTSPTVTNNTDTLTLGTLTDSFNPVDDNGNSLDPISLTLTKAPNSQAHSASFVSL